MLLKVYLPDETMLNGILQKGSRKLFTVSSSPHAEGEYLHLIIYT